MANNLNLISPSSKIKVFWDDQPHNYSKEAKIKIRNSIANKYGVNKNNITIIYRPIKINENGEAIEITGAGIDNIMDINYQRSLMLELINKDGKTIDFKRILALDDKVNGELNLDSNSTSQKSWSIKWLMIDNFLSFGNENFIQFSKLNGLTIVNSIPENQGGKCVRGNTNIKIKYNSEEIIKTLGFFPNELTEEIEISVLESIYGKYGDLGFTVDTPFGYKKITWCGITEIDAEVYRCELENGKYVEGADYHKLKKEDGDFVVLKNLLVGETIQTIDGLSKVKSIELMDFKDTLYDIQVDDVHQYYSNGIVSHNTTLTIDAIKFLLHGNTTKTDTNEQVFNSFSGKNEFTVRGMVEIDNDEVIIERKLKRNAKKGGGWTITNKVKYYKLLPDGEEEELNEENAIQTNKKIRESIGSEKDFEMLVLATEKNLEDLIGLTTTESGKLLTRLIGLEVLEHKEKVAREMYNLFSKKKKSNDFDVVTLTTDIEDTKLNLIELDKLSLELSNKLTNTKLTIENSVGKVEHHINNKEKIDVTISNMNPESLEADIKIITEKGKLLNNTISNLKENLSNVGTIIYDEYEHIELNKKYNELITQKALTTSDIVRIRKVVTNLISSGICQTCERKLDDVDNTSHINKHEIELNVLMTKLSKIDEEVNNTNLSLLGFNDIKKTVDDKNKLELTIDRYGVDLGALRNDVVAKMNDFKKYNMNLDAISLNKKLDIEISYLKTELIVLERSKDDTMNSIQRLSIDTKSAADSIIVKTDLIEVIKKEEEVEKIFKYYIELVGKKGISKLVLRSVLPIINSEVQRLLEDIVDFEVEIFINDKNDVQFLIVKDEVSNLLKSGSGLEKTIASLALRAVLGKISSLPMPNFITFDEVLGKIAPVNLEKLRLLFDKIKDMYDIVFFITHNDLVKDWSNNLITVIKKDNISSINIK
jgi:hypothetical protein